MLDVTFLHAPSVYDFRKKPIFYGPVSDVIPSSPVFEMYPIGFMTISAHLEAAGFKTRIVNLAVRMLSSERFDAERQIRRLSSRIFAIDLHWMPHAHGALEVARMVKAIHPDSMVALGGFTSSYFCNELIARPEVDAVMRGDTTELPHVALAEAVSKGGDLSGVPNLLWKDSGGRIHDNGVTHVAQDLDDIIFDYGVMVKTAIRNMDFKGVIPWKGWEHTPLTSVFSVRGCTMNCAECGGSRSANGRVACRNAPAFRSPERLADDMAGIQRYLDSPIFIVGDLRQGGRDYPERLFKAARERRVENHVVVELFSGAGRDYFSSLDRAFEGGWSIEFSPDSHDEAVRSALGKGYSNGDIERSVEAAFQEGCSRFDLFYMTGLPFQTRESAIGSAKAAEGIWGLAGREDRLFIYNAPFAPFVDPGSRAFEDPERWGYRFFARTLEEHRRLLDSPSWKHVLSYETRWMTRDEIADASYDAAVELADAEHRAGRISRGDRDERVGRTEAARALMRRVDEAMGLADPEERASRLWEIKADGVRMMDSTVCDKGDLSWDARSVWRNGPRMIRGLISSRR